MAWLNLFWIQLVILVHQLMLFLLLFEVTRSSINIFAFEILLFFLSVGNLFLLKNCSAIYLTH